MFSLSKKLLSLSESSVLAHIEGPAGSGKTTLLRNLQKRYPSINFKDIDIFVDQSIEQLHSWEELPSLSREEYNKIFLLAQKKLDSWIKNKKKPIVLGGIHLGVDKPLDIATKNKYSLNTGVLKSSWRALQRDIKNTPELKHPIHKKIKFFTKASLGALGNKIATKNLGYIPKSAEQISQEIDRLHKELGGKSFYGISRQNK